MQVNIDDFFKEQNEAFKAPTQLQQQHWSGMQQLLQPPVVKPSVMPKLIAAVVLVVAIVTGIYYWTQKTKAPQEVATTTPIENKPTAPMVATVMSPKDTTVVIKPTKTPAPAPKKEIATPKNITAPTTPVGAKPITKKTITPNFYIQLSKAPQIFTIDPTKDNTLTCKEGTVIKIPANILVNAKGQLTTGEISFIVQEYYRYDDLAAGSLEQLNENKKGKIATAGMVKFDAFQNDEKLTIAQGKSLQIKMKPELDKNIPTTTVVAEEGLSEKSITELGWISSEQFITDSREKIDLIIELDQKFNASTFMSQIAFTNIKAIMPGNIEKNKLIFQNVPLGENIYFISLGKIKDKYFSCVKKLTTSKQPITNIDYVETTAEQFRKQLAVLNQLGIKEN
jgi:hypothetical protein